MDHSPATAGLPARRYLWLRGLAALALPLLVATAAHAADAVTVDATGKVGINNATPSELLDVNGTTLTLSLSLGASAADGHWSGDMLRGPTSGDFHIASGNPTGGLRFSGNDSNATHFFIDDDGEISVGNTWTMGKFTIHNWAGPGESPNGGLVVSRTISMDADASWYYPTGGSTVMEKYDIPAGVSTTGEMTASVASAEARDENFQGTIQRVNAFVAEAGIYNAGDTAVIDIAKAVHAKIWNNDAGATINKGYGVYIEHIGTGPAISSKYDLYASTSDARNYFAGDVGIKTAAPQKALHVVGDAEVTGNLTKGSGNFLIDHPLDPENRDLYHGFVESARYELVYRGRVRLSRGRARVSIDAASSMSEGTFAALTQNPDVFVQNQSGWEPVRGAVQDGVLTIECRDPASKDTVSWLVVAERADPQIRSLEITDADGHLIPEHDKPELTAEELDRLTATDHRDGVEDSETTEDVVEVCGRKGHVRHPRAYPDRAALPTRKVITRARPEQRVSREAAE